MSIKIEDSTRLARCLLRGDAYFGSALAAMQGPPERHSFFLPTAVKVCERYEGPIRILEIGSWAGASSITWVKAFLELGRSVTIDCVDNWAPYFDLNRELHESYIQMNEAAATGDIYKLFLHNIHAEKIDAHVSIYRGDSQEILPKLNAESYHLIYIDASHLYPDVRSDIREAKRLILDGGIICGDDLEVQANQLSSQELLQAVEAGLDYTRAGEAGSFHPGVTAAVSEELGPVSSWKGYWAIRWDAGKTVQIALDLSMAKLPIHIQHAIVEEPQFQVELVFEGSTHNIVKAGAGYIAVSKVLGVVELFHERIGERDLGDIVLLGNDLDDLKRRIDALSQS